MNYLRFLKRRTKKTKENSINKAKRITMIRKQTFLASFLALV